MCVLPEPSLAHQQCKIAEVISRAGDTKSADSELCSASLLKENNKLHLAICFAILSRGKFGFLGLIGSKTKKARFVRRLRQAGVAPQILERLVCPIGIAEISDKAPNMVALSIAAQLAIWQQIKGNRWPGSSDSIDIAGVRDD